MANNWWEQAPLTEQKSEEGWQAAPEAKADEWWKAAPLMAKPEPTESGGFFGSFWTSLKERANTALPAAKLYTGLGDQAEATKELAKAHEESEKAYKQTEFGEIGDAAKAGNYGEALGKTVDKFREVAGSSFGSMAPAVAAGAGASAAVAAGVVAAPFALSAAAVGTAAFGLATLGSYIADNISVQKEKQAKEGREGEDINRLSATVAAAGSTALDIFGFKFFKPLGALIGLEGKEAAQRTTAEIIENATKPKAYAKAVAEGSAKGIAFEVPQEVAQQVLERWQADKALDPFSDPDAAKEYLEAAGGAMLLGGPMGGASHALGVRSDRAKLKTEEAAAEIDALNKSVATTVRPPKAEGEAPTLEVTGQPDPERIAQLTAVFEAQNVPHAAEAALGRATVEAKEEQEYANAQREAEGAAATVEPVAGPSGVGAGVAVQPGAEPAPGGVGGVEPSGMVPAGPDASQPAVGEGQTPVALIETEPSPNAFSKLVRMEYGEPISLVAKNKAGEEVGRLTYMPNGGPIDVFVREQDRRKGIATALYDAHKAAGGKLPAVGSGVAISDEARAVRSSREVTPEPVSSLQTVIAEVEKAATAELQPVEEAIAELQVPKAETAPEIAAEAAPVVEEVAAPEVKKDRFVSSFDGKLWTHFFPGAEVKQERYPGAPAKVVEVVDRPDRGADYKLEVDVSQHPDGYDENGDRVATKTVLVSDEELNQYNPAAAVAPEAPKKGRGRPALTEEQRVANRAATRAASKAKGKAAKEATSSVDTAISALDTALAPIDESTIETDEQLTDAERQKRLGKVKAIKALLLMQESMSKTDTARGKIEAALKNPAISAKEIADVRTGIAYEKNKVSLSEKGGKVGKPEVGFSKATTGSQALAQIIKTGNGFQKFVAQRLRGFVNGVEFVVLEKGDPLPEQLQQNQKEWNAARGLFVENLATKTRVIYVRGASFGADHGIDHVTVLHELLHAATGQKISLGLAAIANGFSTNALLTRATRAFTRVMRNSRDAYNAMDKAGTVPDDLRTLVESTLYVDKNGQPRYKIFELEQEFLAYGMTEPAMQKFLMTVEPTQARGSAFNRFVRAIMEYFGIGEKDFSAMTDLVLITDKILSAKKTDTMRKLERVERGENYEQVFASAKQTRVKVDKTVEKVEKSNLADSIRSGGYIEQLVGMRDQNKAVDVLVTSGIWTKNAVMQQLLPAMQTSTLVQWATKLGVKGLDAAWSSMNRMSSMKNKAINDMVELADKLNALAAKNAKQYKALGNVMHYSTIVSRDPNTVTTDKSLTEMWARLTPESKKLYNEVREYYANNHKAYHTLLDEQINASDMQSEAKAKLIASIKKMYEDGEKLYPYFPLMRYGQYWVRIGKGKAREFQMFESRSQRDAFVRARIKQLNAETGNTRTKAEMMEGLDLDEGNDLTNARKQDVAASEMLKEIFNSIDEGTKKGEAVDTEKLKDEIYQMYLQTLPDRNFRRQFMHRQGVAGFSGDIHRNFVTTGTNMANQLARIKHGPEIMRDIERAKDSLVGNPDKAKLGEFVAEMNLRAEAFVRPTPENSATAALSNFLNTGAFLWMMTSVKTMVAQLTAVPVFVGPVLASHHGHIKTAAALAKTLNVFNGLGVTKTNPDGSTSYTMPSMSQLKGLTTDEKLATQYMLDNGISDTTMAYDLTSRRGTPTALNQGSTRRVLKATSNAMTALFHHGERMIREVTFLTSYRLNRDKGMSHEAALEAATAESHEALGNYNAINRPRGILATSERAVTLGASSPLGRSILQFKMFPAFVTTYFVRNAYNMFKGLTPQERKQARIQFLGSLGMSYALAGYVGIPGMSMAMGVLQTALNALKDDDEDDPLEGRKIDVWLRNVWLPQTFGNVKIGGHTLDELLDKGLISGLTGYDITSSLSMNNMWFPEMKEQATTTATWTDYALSMAGPSVSMVKQAARGVDYFKQGDILRAAEQVMPAIARAPMTAARYAREGATTTSGASIKDAEEFTVGELLAQSAGFATEGLQSRREAIFQVQGQILEAKRERSAVLLRLDKELLEGSNADVTKAIEKLINYNTKSWWDPIDGDHISQSMQKRMERRFMSDRGFPIDEKYYPQVLSLLEPSSKRLEREAKRNTTK